MALTEMTPTEMLLKVIPENPIKAIAEMDIVGILFFIIFLSIAMLKLGKRRVAPVFNFFEGLNDIIRVLVGWVLKLAPVGVGCLIAHTIGTQDFEFMKTLLDSLWRFAMCVTLGLVTHFLILLVLAWWIGKTNPIKFLSCFGPAMATAFGSSSSSATLPVTMSCVQKMGVSRRISNFVLPVGATLNMDGTALFEAVAVIFFAQAFGFQLEFGAKLLVAVTSVIAAMGAAGIPSAGLVTMTLVLSAAGLPTNQMQVLWAIDRPLDMMRTVVNITGDAVTATVVQARLPEIRQDEDELYEEYEEVEPEASRDEPA
jgi:Na+/H+-dicarboxylate symporter